MKRKLVGDAYRDALKEKNIEVLGYPDIEEIQFQRGQSLMFAATYPSWAPQAMQQASFELDVARETR